MASSLQSTVRDIALTYVGTPYQHQGRAPGQGLDCAGVVECPYRAAGCDLPLNHNYERVPDGYRLQSTLEQYFSKTTNPIPGDVMLISMFGVPHHLAIYDGRKMIHAYSNVGRCVHHIIDAKWRRMTKGVYTWLPL